MAVVDTTVPSQANGAPEADPPSGRALFVLGALTILGIRLVLGWLMAAPHVVPDELGYLAPARLLAGQGVAIDMVHSGLYHPGYSVLITPLFWLSNDPGTTYRLVLTLNAVFGVGTYAATYWGSRRLLGASPRVAVAAAGVASLYPGTLVDTAYTWAENVLPMVIIGLVAAAANFARAPSGRRAVLFASVASLAYVFHPRMLVTFPVVVLIIALVWFAGSSNWRHLVVAVLVIAGTYLAMRVVRVALLDALYTPGDRIGEDIVTSRVFDPSLWPRLASLLLGQVWYLLVGSFGLIAIGGAAMAAGARPPGGWRKVTRRGLADPTIVVAVTVTLLSAGLLAVTAILLVNVSRFDQVFYGRYVEVVSPLLIAAAVVAIASQRRNLAAVAWLFVGLTVLSTVAVAQYPIWDNGLTTTLPMAHGVAAALRFFADRGVEFADGQLVLRVGAVGVAGGSAIALLARFRYIAVPVAAALLLTSSLYTFDEGTRPESQRHDNSTPFTDEVAALAGGQPIGYVPHGGGSVYVYQWFAPELDIDTATAHTREFVLALPTWQEGIDRGYKIVALDPARSEALWEQPGERLDALDRAGVDYPTPFPSALSSEAQRSAIDLISPREPLSVVSGSVLPLDLRVAHEGSGQRWPNFEGSSLGDSRGRVRVAVRIMRGDETLTDQRIDLPFPLAPGESVQLSGDLVARHRDGRSLEPGEYELFVDVIQELLVEFHRGEGMALRVPLRVIESPV